MTRAYIRIVNSCTNDNQGNQPCPLALPLLGLQKATFTNGTHIYIDQCVQFYQAWDSSDALNQLSPARTRIPWPKVSHNQRKLFRVSSHICAITYVDRDGGLLTIEHINGLREYLQASHIPQVYEVEFREVGHDAHKLTHSFSIRGSACVHLGVEESGNQGPTFQQQTMWYCWSGTLWDASHQGGVDQESGPLDHQWSGPFKTGLSMLPPPPAIAGP